MLPALWRVVELSAHIIAVVNGLMMQLSDITFNTRGFLQKMLLSVGMNDFLFILSVSFVFTEWCHTWLKGCSALVLMSTFI